MAPNCCLGDSGYHSPLHINPDIQFSGCRIGSLLRNGMFSWTEKEMRNPKHTRPEGTWERGREGMWDQRRYLCVLLIGCKPDGRGQCTGARSIFILSRKTGHVSQLCMDSHRVNCYPVNCPIVCVVSEDGETNARERHGPVETPSLGSKLDHSPKAGIVETLGRLPEQRSAPRC